MEQNHPLVSISLLTWNGEKYLKGCLDSVFDQTYPNIEILILDNGSTDGTVEYIKSISDRKNIKYLGHHPENTGFAPGHNEIIRECKGEFVFLLNQDVKLHEDFIKEALRVFDLDKGIGSVQGKAMQWREGYIDTTGMIMLKNRRTINRGQGQLDKGQFEEVDEVFGVDGAVPIYRKETLEDVKVDDEYFDNDFFAYKEDVDMAWRLRLAGWKAFYQPKAIAYHDRTSGENTALSYWDIIKERLKISKFSKYLSFKNGRLMQIKNEQIGVLIRHLPWFLPKEIGAWGFATIFERYTWKAFIDIFKQMPVMFKKRRIIMGRRRVSSKEMARWFK